MYNLNFASNENFTDAAQAFALLVQAKKCERGATLEELKSLLAQQFFVNNNQVFFTLAARSALHLFLSNLHLPKQSEVLVQAFTCEAVVLPVLAANLSVIYVDIEDETWSMDVADLKKKMTNKSRVLILQHSFAMLPRDRARIFQLAKKYQLIVIEDLAHGFSPKLLAANNDSSTKLLSFGRSKFFSAVYGGAMIVESAVINDQFVQAIAQLKPADQQLISKALFYKVITPFLTRSYCWGGKIFHALFNYLSIFNKEITQQERAGEYDPWLERALPDVFACLILKQLKNYEKTYLHRQRIAHLYWQQLAQKISKDNLPSLRYPILIDEADLFLQKMAKKGYILGDWYRQPVAPLGLNLAKVNYQWGACPRAEQMSQQVINLPLNISYIKAQQLLKELINVKKNFN